MLEKKNGKTKPDMRDAYLFGQSLPIAAKELDRSVEQNIKDLHAKAGEGPICEFSCMSGYQRLTGHRYGHPLGRLGL
jgi:hypothetical protein